MDSPHICRDPRFRAGRKLMERGNPEQAADVFAQLLEGCRQQYGDASVESAPTYYEYGNALLRSYLASEQPQEVQIPDDPREAAARAAQQRAFALSTINNDTSPEPKVDHREIDSNKGDASDHTEDVSGEDIAQQDNEDDQELALEMMETSWSILDENVQQSPPLYAYWTNEQLPRVLTGLGDCLSSMDRHADATDAYLRALEFRQKELDSMMAASKNAATLEILQCRRRIVETYVLISEELLACRGDVVTTETKDVLVTENERVEYARGYYNKARDELQETVFVMGKLAANNVDTSGEKEDVCFASTLLMALGMRFAEIDEAVEEEAQEIEPAKKKAKY